METNDIDQGAPQNIPCPYCGSTADQTPHGEQVRCNECGNSFTPTGEIVHASMPARTEVAPAPVVAPAAATGLHCPRCFAPAGQPHSTGCNEAGLASAVRKAIDMLAGVVAAAPNGPLALPAALGVLRCGLEAEQLNAPTSFEIEDSIGLSSQVHPESALASSPAKGAARDVLAERRRQVEVEGYEPEHDDGHPNGEIAAYAAFFAMPPAARDWPASETGYGMTFGHAIVPSGWPVPKEGNRRRELVKAGALILAEIERIDRPYLRQTSRPAQRKHPAPAQLVTVRSAGRALHTRQRLMPR